MVCVCNVSVVCIVFWQGTLLACMGRTAAALTRRSAPESWQRSVRHPSAWPLTTPKTASASTQTAFTTCSSWQMMSPTNGWRGELVWLASLTAQVFDSHCDFAFRALNYLNGYGSGPSGTLINVLFGDSKPSSNPQPSTSSRKFKLYHSFPSWHKKPKSLFSIIRPDRVLQPQLGRFPEGSCDLRSVSEGAGCDPWTTRHWEDHHCGGDHPAGGQTRPEGEKLVIQHVSKCVECLYSSRPELFGKV